MGLERKSTTLGSVWTPWTSFEGERAVTTITGRRLVAASPSYSENIEAARPRQHKTSTKTLD